MYGVGVYHTIEKYASFLSGFNQVFIRFFSGTVPLSVAMVLCMQHKERKRGRKNHPTCAKGGYSHVFVIHNRFPESMCGNQSEQGGFLASLSVFYSNTYQLPCQSIERSTRSRQCIRIGTNTPRHHRGIDTVVLNACRLDRA